MAVNTPTTIAPESSVTLLPPPQQIPAALEGEV
jgi:hypothetical protein